MHVCVCRGWGAQNYHFACGWNDEPHRQKHTVGPALPQVNHVIKLPSKAEAQGLRLKCLTSYSLRDNDMYSRFTFTGPSPAALATERRGCWVDRFRALRKVFEGTQTASDLKCSCFHFCTLTGKFPRAQVLRGL